MANASVIDGAFRNPVFDAQSTFRAIMDAMARPGSVGALAPPTLPPAPLTASGAAVLLTLCDQDTPVWLDPQIAELAAAREWIAFHTGAPVTANPVEAHFALVSRPADLIALENFTQGSQDYPDRSTTLILQVDALDTGRQLVLEGPGIESRATLAPSALPRHFAEQWGQNNRRFPRGVNVIFAATSSIACLPRTTRIVATES